MNKEVVEALEGSIKKWWDIKEGKGVDKGGLNCPLCLVNLSCDTCSVMIAIGKENCDDTPCKEWCRHQYLKHYNEQVMKIRCAIARKRLEDTQKDIDSKLFF